MIALPLPVDWSDEYVEEWSWLTEVIESDDGSEQRRALRVLPRHKASFRTTDVEGRMRLRRQQAQHLADLLIFGDEIRQTRLSVAASLGANQITVEVRDWLSSAEWLVVGVGELAQPLAVESVTGGVVTLVESLPAGLPSGAVLRLGLPARLETTQSADALSTEFSRGGLKVEIEPGSELLVTGVAPTMFNGREVLSHRPDWSEAPAFEYADSQTYADNDVGVRSPQRRRAWTRETVRTRHLIRSLADANGVTGVFHRARGRQGEVYLPSWVNDFPLLQTVNSGSKFWRTAGHGFADAYAGSTVYRAMAVVLKAGSIHYFRIADITAGGTSPQWSMIETLEGAPSTLAPSDVDMICLMPVARFVSDSLTVSWRSNQVAYAQLNLTTLEDL